MLNKINFQIIFLALMTVIFAESPIKTILPNEVEAGNQFGKTTVVSGNWIAISAPKNDDNGYSSGSVDIFKLVENNWEFQQTILPLNLSAFNYFGHSLAMEDSVLVVGAPGDSENGHKSGAVYVFRNTENGWIEETCLRADDGKRNDSFGESVAIFDDRILVGAHRGSGLSTKTGCAYSFSYDGNDWIQSEKIFADDGNDYDHFGCSVALSENWALVGSYQSNSKQGAAYLFFNGDLSLLESQPAISIDEEVKWEVDIPTKNNEIKDVNIEKYITKKNISKGRIFEKENKTIPARQPETRIVKEEKKNNHSGDNPIVRNATRTETENRSWTQFQKLEASDGQSGSFFGYSVDICESDIVIGSYLADGIESQSGAVYLYQFQNETWGETIKIFESMGKKHDYFGIHVDIDVNRLFVGASHSENNGMNSGEILYYQRSNDSWNLVHTFVEDEESHHNHFGLNFSVDDQMLIAGSSLFDGESQDEGKAYTFWPDINIVQEDYAITGPRGTVFLDSLEITNSSLSSLMFELDADVDWVSLYPLTNILESQSTEVVDFLINATEIDTGMYSQTITVSYPESNIPNQIIHLSIHVEGGLVGIDDINLPLVYSLQQNYPNPFNPTTTIQFSVPERSKAELKIFDVMGREVITLVNQDLEPGYHQITWNGRNRFGKMISSGMYFTVMQSGDFRAVKKMVMLK